MYNPARTSAALGRLVRRVMEPMYPAEQWYGKGGARTEKPIHEERVWYLLLPDGREYRWVNADFIVIPTVIMHSGWGAEFVSDPLAFLPQEHAA